jgi:hypothetical protein
MVSNSTPIRADVRALVDDAGEVVGLLGGTCSTQPGHGYRVARLVEVRDAGAGDAQGGADTQSALALAVAQRNRAWAILAALDDGWRATAYRMADELPDEDKAAIRELAK